MTDIMEILRMRDIEPPGTLKHLAAQEVARQSRFRSDVREALRFNESVRQPMIEQRRQEIGRWRAGKERWNQLNEFRRALDRADPAHLGQEAAAHRARSNANLAGLEAPDLGMRSPLASFKFYDEGTVPVYTDDFVHFVCQRLDISQADDVVSMGLHTTKQHFPELLGMKLDLPTTAASTLLRQLWRDYMQERPRRSRRLAGYEPAQGHHYVPHG